MHVARKNGRVERLFKSSLGAPIYIYWAPDSLSLSFIMQESTRGFTLYLLQTDSGRLMKLDAGSPYYWDWSPDSRTIVAHAGGENGVTTGRLSLISVNGRGQGKTDMPVKPGLFQSPVFASNGSTVVAAVRDRSNRSSLAGLSREGQIREGLAGLEGAAVFSRSPDGRRLAFIDGSPTPLLGAVGSLRLIDFKPGLQMPRSANLPRGVSAFFWSPDGSRIAYFVPELQRTGAQNLILLFTLFILDAESQEASRLLTFIPSPDFVQQIVPFHDQYQRSHTIWSPDSEYLVLDNLTSEGKPGIFTVSVSGREETPEPRMIAHGNLPFWSP